MKNVQIPYDLFISLLQYHLMKDKTFEDKIIDGLEQKINSLVKHELYTKYKTEPTEELREQARQEYLNRRGIPKSFRWNNSP